MKHGFLTLAGTALALALSLGAFAQSQDELYRQGIAAFREADYETAAAYFEGAREAGMETTTLSYNLGSTYFKLGRYAEARSMYEAIAEDPAWGATAKYNLGLIAERQGNTPLARRYYQEAYEQSTSDGIRSRAATKLGLGTSSTEQSAWQIYLSAAAGFDDRASSLASISPGSQLGESDQFASLSGSVANYLSGDYRNGYRLAGAFYMQEYQDVELFDINVLSLALDRDNQGQNWHGRTSLKLDNFWLQGNLFGRRVSLAWRGIRNLDSWQLRVDGSLGYWDAGSGYDYISGWQNRVRGAVSRSLGANLLSLGYQLEVNDREDRQIDGDFYSYSPMRHQLFAGLGRDFGRLDLSARTEFEFSRYAEANVISSATPSAVERADDKLKLTVRADYQFSSAWSGYVSYAYTDRASNIDEYDYQNNQFLLGLELNF